MLGDASPPELFLKARSRLWRLWTWIATDSWALEYAAPMIAMLSLARIGIILEFYRELPSSSWTYTVTLDTVIITLATS
jgi:hypothetical protein